MRFALIQLDIEWENQKANYLKVERLIAEAKQKGAEFVCLPELFSTGVTMNANRFKEDICGKTCAFLSKQAKLNKVYLLGTFIEESKGLPLNTVVVYGENGELVAKYSKNHVFTYGGEDKVYSNGDGIKVFKVRGLVVALFVCYDLRFPEIFRIAVDMGANIFIIPANWPNPRKEHWVTLLKARAIENQAFVVGINRCGNSPELSFFGNSMIVSPKGVVVRVDKDEQILFGDINVNEVNDWRVDFTALKDRRGSYYKNQSLISDRKWEDVWSFDKEYSDYLIKRAKGELPLMESTKQLVKLMKPIYKKGFKVLDVCCSSAHYLVGLRKIDENIKYYGVDNVKYLVDAANEIFKGVNISIGDIYGLKFKDKEFDITYCFNTLQSLPDFREPLKELLRVTRKYCFVRMLISDNTYFIEERVGGGVLYSNIYSFKEISDFILTLGNFKCELINDEFNIELESNKSSDTRTIGGLQIVGNIIYSWKILKMTRLS